MWIWLDPGAAPCIGMEAGGEDLPMRDVPAVEGERLGDTLDRQLQGLVDEVFELLALLPQPAYLLDGFGYERQDHAICQQRSCSTLGELGQLPGSRYIFSSFQLSSMPVAGGHRTTGPTQDARIELPGVPSDTGSCRRHSSV
jgi:hypothetical protein